VLPCECKRPTCVFVLLCSITYPIGNISHEKAIQEHADRLIREHGDDAYRIALEAALAARRQRRSGLEQFLEKVTREISHRAPRSSLNRRPRYPPELRQYQTKLGSAGTNRGAKRFART
jgi:hypothetical protein